MREISAEELKSSVYYLGFVDETGARLGVQEWPKGFRSRVGAFIRNPSEYFLTNIASTLAERIASPTEHDIALIKSASSSIADRIHPSITLGLIYARALDEIKINTIGRNAPTTGVNTLMTLMTSEAMWRAKKITEADIEDAVRLISAWAQHENPHFHWYIPKLFQMTQAAGIKLETEGLLPKIKGLESDVSAEELAVDNDRLFNNLVQLRKYGLKSCVAPALRQGKTREWLVSDVIPEAYESSFAAYHPARKSLAAFDGSRGKIDTTEVIPYEYISETSGGQVRVSTQHVSGIKPNEDTFHVLIGPDGHLYYRAGVRWIDYIDPNLYQKYEQLRAEILSILFDAVVPVYITEQVKKDAGQTPKGILGKLALGNRRPPNLKRLVLARTRILEEKMDEIVAALENSDTDEVESDEQKRIIAKHNVEWHIRRLPAEFRASPEARQRCLQETGIVLAEHGETYVRKHTRGSIEKESKGHRAVFAAGQVASKLRRQKH